MAISSKEFAERTRHHGQLLHRAVEGASEAIFWTPPAPKANSMAFLVLHMSDLRHFAARQLGLSLKAPWAEVLSKAETAEDIPEDFRPESAEVVAHLEATSAALIEALGSLDEAKLAAPALLEFPIEDPTLGGVLTFLLDHEESLLHQLGQLRILFDLPRMDFE